MQARRLFAYAWRANAILILVAALLFNAAMGFLLQSATQNALRSHTVAPATAPSVTASVEASAPEAAPIREQIELGHFAAIDGIAAIRAPLYLGRRPTDNRETSPIRDWLFVDTNTTSTYWLRGKSTGILLQTHPLTVSRDTGKQRPTRGFLFVLLDAGDNAGHPQSDSDRQQLAIADANGTRFKILLRNVSRLHGHEFMPNGHLLVLYATNGRIRGAQIDLRSQRVVTETKALGDLDRR